MSFSIGPGVANAIKEATDEARSSELYLTDGVSVTYARDAIYYYYKQDNTTKRLPFDAAQ